MRPSRVLWHYARERHDGFRSGVGLGELLEALLAEDDELVLDDVDDLDLELPDEGVTLGAGETLGVVVHVQVALGADVRPGDVRPGSQGGGDPRLVLAVDVGVSDVRRGEVHLELQEADLVGEQDALDCTDLDLDIVVDLYFRVGHGCFPFGCSSQ